MPERRRDLVRPAGAGTRPRTSRSGGRSTATSKQQLERQVGHHRRRPRRRGVSARLDQHGAAPRPRSRRRWRGSPRARRASPRPRSPAPSPAARRRRPARRCPAPQSHSAPPGSALEQQLEAQLRGRVRARAEQRARVDHEVARPRPSSHGGRTRSAADLDGPQVLVPARLPAGGTSVSATSSTRVAGERADVALAGELRARRVGRVLHLARRRLRLLRPARAGTAAAPRGRARPARAGPGSRAGRAARGVIARACA